MNKSFKDFFIYSFVSGLSGAISVLLLPILTVYLTPEDYGILSIFNACVRFVSACIGLGMSHVLLVDLVKNRGYFVKRLKGYLILIIGLATIFFFIALIYSFFYTHFFGIPIYLMLIIPFVSLLVVFFEFSTGIMVFLKQANKFAFYSLSKFGIETFLTLFFVVFLGLNWNGRVASLILALLIMVSFVSFYINNEFNLKQKTNKVIQTSIKLLKEGGLLFFMSVSFMLINLSDRFFIEHLEGVSETGIYSVGATIASVMFVVIAALMQVLRPQIYELLNNSKYRKLNKISLFYHSGLLLITVIILSLIPTIFQFFIDESFHNAEFITFILVIGLFFWGGYNFYVSYILFKKQHRLNSIIGAFSIILNLILNYLFIKDFGALGAAYATLITYVCMFTMSIIFSLKINGFSK